MLRRADYNLARMSGMLDLSRDEKAKHFLPRWLREAPTWITLIPENPG